VSNPTGRTADELRRMGYGVKQALADGYKINEDDDRFLVAYKGDWPETDGFFFLHRGVVDG
jgi:hypothetical protein